MYDCTQQILYSVLPIITRSGITCWVPFADVEKCFLNLGEYFDIDWWIFCEDVLDGGVERLLECVECICAV